MKILFLLNNDIHALKSLNILLPNLDFSEISISFSQKVGQISEKNPYLEKFKYYEKDLLVEKSQILEKENKISKFLSFNQLIKKYKIKELELNNINSSESESKIKSFQPDLIISIRYGQILKPNIVKISKNGVINLHSGIMPKYRGIMSTFWAILNNEKEIGTTLHFIEDEKIDNGQIINISRQRVDFERSLIYNIFSLYDKGCQMIIGFVKNEFKIESKDLKIESKRQYFSLPKVKDFEDLKEKIELINDRDIKEIYQNLS